MMNKAKGTAFSGCLIWFLLLVLIGSCILPLAFIVGGISSSSQFAIKTMGGYLCPENTTPESYSYATTTTDENGFTQPSTAYELHCVDAQGAVVKNDPIVYAFGWIGLSALAGVIVSALLSFVFAVPGGMLVTKLLEKFRSPKTKADE
jgi:ABC-type glycerol-3-phosphate transport system permease component